MNFFFLVSRLLKIRVCPTCHRELEDPVKGRATGCRRWPPGASGQEERENMGSTGPGKRVFQGHSEAFQGLKKPILSLGTCLDSKGPRTQRNGGVG